MQLREYADELEHLGVQIYAVTFETASRVSIFQDRDPLPFPMLRDPQRNAYKRFGLGRRSATTIWGPKTLLYYGLGLPKGRLPRNSGDADQYQLGGDVLLGADRRRGWIYRSSDPVDRPSVGSILRMASHSGPLSNPRLHSS